MTVTSMNRKTGRIIKYDARNILSLGSNKISIAYIGYNDKLVTVTIPLRTHVVSIDP